MDKSDDVLDQKLNELIGTKIESALKPIIDKLDAISQPAANEDEPPQTEKLDAFKVATETLRTKLDGFIPTDELAKMDLMQLSTRLGILQGKLAEPAGGTRNQIREKNDAADNIFKNDPTAMRWEE